VIAIWFAQPSQSNARGSRHEYSFALAGAVQISAANALIAIAPRQVFRKDSIIVTRNTGCR
jgi:hypothetical protein